MIVGVVFGGASTENNESLRAAQYLYKYAIKSKLEDKYNFKYFYLSEDNLWASDQTSRRLIRGLQPKDYKCSKRRLLDLGKVDVIYSTCMGTCGENGNIPGLANLLGIPIIGCDILASALALDKRLSKIVVSKLDIPIVDYLYIKRDTDPQRLAEKIQAKIGFPCFVKPTNLGTCAYVFRANNREEFIDKWRNTIRKNKYSQYYLIEKFIPNIEVRIFVVEDQNGKLHTNDGYVTTLKEKSLRKGGSLFDHVDNTLSQKIRNKIKDYAITIFRTFGMKDYSRIDFFVSNETGEIYFNEANTQPFIGGFNVKLMEQDGLSYSKFLDMMIKKYKKYD